MDFEIRECRQGDGATFLPLLGEALRGGDRRGYQADFWEWKHERNPFGRSYGIYAWDRDANRVAALRALMRWEFSAPSGETVRAVRAVDTATSAEYRRSGLFRALTERAVRDLREEGCGLVFNTPNPQSLAGYLKMGWSVVAIWPLYVRLLRPGALLKLARRKNAPAESLDPWGACFGEGVLRWREFTKRYGGEVEKLLSRWEGARIRVGIRTRRVMDYLEWRYGGHPQVDYGVVAVEQASELTGFAVLRPNFRFGLREVVITELALSADPVRAGKELLSRVRKTLRADYCIASFSEGTVELGLLKRAFFLKVPRRGITFTCRPLNPTTLDPLRQSNWDLSLGDLEVF